MLWLFAFIVGLLGGAGVTYGALSERVSKARRQEDFAATSLTEAKNIRDDARAKYGAATAELEVDKRAYEQRAAKLDQDTRAFSARVISYEDLVRENAILKRDLQNLDVTLHKNRLDHGAITERQQQLDERAAALAKQFLRDTLKSISSSLNINNYASLKDRLTSAIARVRDIGFIVTEDEERLHVTELRNEYERVLRIAAEREEQARIKAQIREEERLQREAARAIEQAERDRRLVEDALAAALATAKGEHNAEVEALRAQLAEAEERGKRALSMAEQTKAGNVYVISNMGSFGKDVFKVGMTRRLEPLDRIRELGDASVPFPFDVHMMISCDDAPALEHTLHKALHRSRLNKVNPRKEFFRSDIETIAKIVTEHRGAEITYTATAEALEYNESLTMKPEDAEFIEAVFEEVDAAETVTTED